MKKKRNLGRKLLGFLLTLAMVVGLMPCMSLTVRAVDNTAAEVLKPTVTDGKVTEAKVLEYAGKQWYVIASNSVGVQIAAGAVTSQTGETTLVLLAKENWGTAKFNLNNSDGNAYGSSNLKTTIDGFVDSEKIGTYYTSEDETWKNDLVSQRTLAGGASSRYTNYQSVDNIFGSEVTNATLWPLSAAEVSQISSSSTIFQGNGKWWLRSPSMDAQRAAYVPGDYVYSRNVSEANGVRPALCLNLTSDIFASEKSDESGVYELKLSQPAVSYQAASWDSANNKVNYTTESCDSYTVVTSSTTSFENGKWYVVKDDVSINHRIDAYNINTRITVNGTANLILCDGATLTADSITATNATLNIYGQSAGTGELKAESYVTVGIGCTGGTVTIYGGTVTASGGAGIGGGDGEGNSGGGVGGTGGTVTIYGGEVTANGFNGAGIGGDSGSTAGGDGGTVAIYGGTVKANGCVYNTNGSSVGIGGGSSYSGGGKGTDGTLTIGTGMHLYGGTSANPETDLSNHVAQSNGNYARSQYMTVNNFAPHTHSFTYSASGATITATCDGTGACDITDGLELTIIAPTGSLVYDGTTTYPATLSTGYSTTAFPDTYAISYTKDGSAYNGLPKDAGAYTASITVGTGDDAKTASVNFTIAKENAATVTEAPTAKNLTYNGSAQELVIAGTATDGEMQYALGTKEAATEEYTASIPTATEAGTYYVWYKVVGDSNHLDSDAGYVTVTIAISTGFVNDITGTAAATAESNPFETKIINNSDEELKTLFSLLDTDVAQGVNVWLDIQDMSDSVPQTDKTLIQNTSGDYTVGLYLDINLFKKVGNNDATKVTETSGKVKVSIVIPESLWKSGRTFEVIRVHDGVATAIAGTYDENTHVFTFETDKFSTYALAYKDPASSSDSGTTSDSSSSDSSDSTQPNDQPAGDPNGISVWYLLLTASLAGLGFLGYFKKKKVNE